MNKLFVFNPDHELALANDDENFMPKQNVAQLADDLQLLPLWLQKQGISEEYCINSNNINDSWCTIVRLLHLKYRAVDKTEYFKITNLKVWGWNKAIRKKLLLEGIDSKFCPTDGQLKLIREITNRKTTVSAFEYLRDNFFDYHLPNTPKILTLKQVVKYLKGNSNFVLKTPFSSSGRGVFLNNHKLKADSLRNCANGLIVEDYLNVVQNFAMEFRVKSKTEIDFVGYSLFNNKNGGSQYHCNILMSDEKIEKLLSNYVGLPIIEKAKEKIINFLKKQIAEVWFFFDYIGVDMMIYEKYTKYYLNPCVEINFRPTMGIIAHEFYKNYVSQNSEGLFFVDFFENSIDLITDHKKKIIENPRVIKNNKFVQGYLSLCPISENTHYRVRVEIAPSDI